MSRLAHKNGTSDFGSLTFAEQAKSITASINNLQNAIAHHVRHAPNAGDARKKCLNQVHRLLGRLIEKSFLVALLLVLTGCGETGSEYKKEARKAVYVAKAVVTAGESGKITYEDYKQLKARTKEAKTRLDAVKAVEGSSNFTVSWLAFQSSFGLFGDL